ncbi:uncharacterized protein LOC131153939 [Malania oleifera]|uniref:uncharacterized protein LOC131153939 n=1 Tax=Malania oleifera TaxID=397392 RepID=UPI0025AEC5A6|nr:uncharacterized protein LOC131153939 [Malania oleifera]
MEDQNSSLKAVGQSIKSDTSMNPVTASAIMISTNINSIPMLNGSNFKNWKENVMIVLSCMDLDVALWRERPPALADTSTSYMKRDLERWERPNRMSLMIMKHSDPEAFRGSMSNEDDAKVFIVELQKHFTKNENAETSNLLASLVPIRHKGKGNIGNTLWKCLTSL